MTQELHYSTDEAEATFLKAMGKALETKHWMTCVWSVDKEEGLKLFRTTFEFPTDQFHKAMEQLRGNLIEEQDSLLPSAPLPLAPEFFKGTLQDVIEGAVKEAGEQNPLPAEEEGSNS